MLHQLFQVSDLDFFVGFFYITKAILFILILCV